MSPLTLKRNNSNAMIAFASFGLLLIALSAHPQSISSGSSAGGAAAQSAPMGSAADPSGNAGSKASATSSADASAKGGQLSRADSKFMRDIAYANISEIAAAQLAQSKSQNDQVKSFAQKMIDDHTKAQDELKQMAQSKGVSLPTEPDMKHKAAAKALEKLSGDKFDAMYMKQAGLNDHKNAHKLMEKVSKNAKDADLKAYAAKTLGPVDEHLKMAQQQQSKK